jgi:hypothetical protein
MAASNVLVRLKKPLERKAGPVRRVSLELPLDLWRESKMAAFEAGEPLRDLILKGLRLELDKRAKRRP